MTEPRAEEGFDDTFEDDAFDDDVDLEAPEADMLEQHTATREDRARARRHAPLEANDADAAEQDREDVYDDEDDYR